MWSAVSGIAQVGRSWKGWMLTNSIPIRIMYVCIYKKKIVVQEKWWVGTVGNVNH